jgi:hypothetical protein
MHTGNTQVDMSGDQEGIQLQPSNLEAADFDGTTSQLTRTIANPIEGLILA